jgi:hypothetical protein
MQKSKFSISISPDKEAVIMNYLKKHKGMSRSAVIEQAITVWEQSMREAFEEEYYSKHGKSLRDNGWMEIATESTARVWKSNK